MQQLYKYIWHRLQFRPVIWEVVEVRQASLMGSVGFWVLRLQMPCKHFHLDSQLHPLRLVADLPRDLLVRALTSAHRRWPWSSS